MRLVFYGFLLLTTANSRKVSFHCARSETSSAAKIRVFLQNAKNRFILTDLVKDGIPCLKLRNINDDNHEDANLHSTFGFLLWIVLTLVWADVWMGLPSQSRAWNKSQPLNMQLIPEVYSSQASYSCKKDTVALDHVEFKHEVSSAWRKEHTSFIHPIEYSTRRSSPEHVETMYIMSET